MRFPLFPSPARMAVFTERREDSAAPIRGLRPYLLGISVGDLERSARWYVENLGFRVESGPVRPRPRAGFAVLERDGFRLELIEMADSLPRSVAAPVRGSAVSLQGVFKLAFLVDEVDEAHAALRARGVRIRMAPADSPETGMRFCLIEDPDGNVIQLYARIESPAH